MFMAYSHVAHDSLIGNNVVISNSVQIGGHVDIENFVIIGGSTPIHQFCRIGEYSFVGGGYRVVQDVPPFIKAMGEPLKYSGINSIGLNRNNFLEKDILNLKKAYKIIFRSEFNTSQAIKNLKNNFKNNEIINSVIHFIEKSERGII